MRRCGPVAQQNESPSPAIAHALTPRFRVPLEKQTARLIQPSSSPSIKTERRRHHKKKAQPFFGRAWCLRNLTFFQCKHVPDEAPQWAFNRLITTTDVSFCMVLSVRDRLALVNKFSALGLNSSHNAWCS